MGGQATAVAASFQFFVFDGKTYGPSQIDVAAVTPAGQAVTVRPWAHQPAWALLVRGARGCRARRVAAMANRTRIVTRPTPTAGQPWTRDIEGRLTVALTGRAAIGYRPKAGVAVAASNNC